MMAWVLFICVGLSNVLHPQESIAQQAAFEVEPQALLNVFARRKHAQDEDVDHYLDQEIQRFDAQGRRTVTAHRIQRVLTAQGVQSLSVLTVEWAPWYESKPVVKARVITPDGKEHRLDPATVSEAPVGTIGPRIFTDRKMLQAPLPAMQTGAIVETLVSKSEHQPFAASGRCGTSYLESFSDTALRHLRVIFPQELPHRLEVRNCEILPEVTRDDKQTTYEFLLKDTTAAPYPEQDRPPGILPIGHVVYTTARSWKDVAADYHRLIEGKYEVEKLKPLAEQIAGETSSTIDLCERLLRHVQTEVQYTGLEFGSSSIVPQPATQTLNRTLGDCKDQSVLLAGLLRAAGVEAQLALVHTRGYDNFDIDPEMPGLNLFSHVIVYVPEEQIWIDPTAPGLALGLLPASAQNRWALVISKDTRELVRTPRMTAKQNRVERTYELQISDPETVKLIYDATLWGLQARYFRLTMRDATDRQIRDFWNNQFQYQFGSETVERINHDSLADVEDPFHFRLEAQGAERLVVQTDSDLLVSLPVYYAMMQLPQSLQPLAESEQDADKQRKSPLLVPEPIEFVLNFRVTPPAGFELEETPEKEQFEVGGIKYELHASIEKEGAVWVLVTLSAEDGFLKPAEVDDVRKRLAEMTAPLSEQGSGPQLVLHFRHRGAKLFEQGKVREAVGVYRRLMADDPKSAGPLIRYSNLLMQLGFGDAAQQFARRAVALAPDDDRALHHLGLMLTYDSFGHQYGWNVDYSEAESVLRQAVDRNPDNYEALWALANVLEFEPSGLRYTSQERLAESIELLKALRQTLAPNPQLDFQLAYNLLRGGQHEEALSVAGSGSRSLRLNAVELAVLALRDPDAAISRSYRFRLEDVERRQVLAVAADNLTVLRRYPEAARILEKSLEGLPAGTVPQWERSLQSVRNLKPYEELLDEEGTAERLVQDLYAAVLKGAPDAATEPLFWSADGEGPLVHPSLNALREQLRARQFFLRQNFGNFEFLVDSLAFLELDVVGDPEQSQIIRCRFPNTQEMIWFTLPTESGVRLFDPGQEFAEAGRMMLDMLELGEQELPKQWIRTLMRESRMKVSLFDPFAAPPAAYLWIHFGKLDEERRIKLTAAALACGSEHPKPGIEMLTAFLPEAGQLQELQIRRCLARAYANSAEWDQLATVTQPIVRRQGFATTEGFMHVTARWQLQQWEELEQSARLQLDKNARDQEALRIKALIRREAGNYEEAEKLYRQILKNDPGIRPVILRLLSFNALFSERTDEQTVAEASEVRQLAWQQLENWQNLACLQALHGDFSAANATLSESFNVRRSYRPGPNDWAVLGLLAEHCGLTEVARNAYRNVGVPEPFDGANLYNFVQKRLRQLPLRAERE